MEYLHHHLLLLSPEERSIDRLAVRPVRLRLFLYSAYGVRTNICIYCYEE